MKNKTIKRVIFNYLSSCFNALKENKFEFIMLFVAWFMIATLLILTFDLVCSKFIVGIK